MANTITLNNETFSLNTLLIKYEKYLPMMKEYFTERQFAQKSNENFEKYCSRLFNTLYTRVGITTNIGVNEPVISEARTERRAALLDTSCDKILNALGIEVVRHCAQRSLVMFKNSGKSYRMKTPEIKQLAQHIKDSTSLKVKKHTKVKIGVELEFVAPVTNTKKFNAAMKNLVGEDRYKPIMRYNKNDGDKWVLGKDASVKPTGNQRGTGMAGFELTSPIIDLSSKEDVEELRKVCDLLANVFGAEVNSTCGTHVHMSFPVTSASDEMCKHFAKCYRRNEEDVFDKVVPYRRRADHARYSMSVNENYIWDRYQKVNFNNVTKNSKQMHLEFRQLDGTIDFDKIMAWTKLQKLFVELALESWDGKNNKEKSSCCVTDIYNVICSKEVDASSVENLMKMSGMIA